MSRPVQASGQIVGDEVRRGERDRLAERLGALLDRRFRVDVGQRWVSIEPLRAAPRAPPRRPAAPRGGSAPGCRRAGTWPPRARGRRPGRTRRRSSPGRCRRCRRAACRRARASTAYVGGGWSVRENRSVDVADRRRCRRRRPRASRTCRPSRRRATARNFSSPSGAYTGRPLALEAVAQQHVQAVDVDAVVGVLVRDHDRGEVLDRVDVLLQVRERAVAAVDPDRRRRPRARGSRCTRRRAGAPYDPEQPSTVSSTTTPRRVRPRGRGTARPSSRNVIDVAAGDERARLGASGAGARPARLVEHRRGPRTRSRRRSTPARRPGPSRRRSYGRGAGSACSRARACRRRPARTGASSRSASTCTWSESTSPASTNSTKPGHAAHVSSSVGVDRRPRPAGTRPTRSCRRCRSRRPGRVRVAARRGAQPGLDHADHRDRRAGRAARRARPRPRCCTRRRASSRRARAAGRRSRASTSAPRRPASARTGTGRCRRSRRHRSSGRRSMSARSTVSPPSPESNTPIGRVVGAAIAARYRPRAARRSRSRDRGADARRRRRRDREHDVERRARRPRATRA